MFNHRVGRKAHTHELTPEFHDLIMTRAPGAKATLINPHKHTHTAALAGHTIEVRHSVSVPLLKPSGWRPATVSAFLLPGRGAAAKAMPCQQHHVKDELSQLLQY